MIIDFDEESHTYTVDGVKFPSVTTILKAEGLIDSRWFNPRATERGKRVHQALEAIDHGIPQSLYQGSQIEGYLDAWENFKASREPEFTGIEKRVAHKGYQVAGTIDRLGTIEGREVIIDIKTGEPQPWHAIQLAAYLILIDKAPRFIGDALPALRYGVYIKPDGSYKFKAYDDQEDFNLARALFTVHLWKRRRVAA
jgi:hypothetical protein